VKLKRFEGEKQPVEKERNGNQLRGSSKSKKIFSMKRISREARKTGIEDKQGSSSI